MNERKDHPAAAPQRGKPTFVEGPPGYMGTGFFATSADKAIGLARKNSLWPLPFATSCCGIEFMSLMSSHYDLARFGMERLSFSPRQSDLLWVVGTISQRQAPVLKRIYEQMMEPKWVLAFGTCASCGGFYDNYTTVPGIDKIIPCDVYVPGCPPRPDAFAEGLLLLQDLVGGEQRPLSWTVGSQRVHRPTMPSNRDRKRDARQRTTSLRSPDGV